MAKEVTTVTFEEAGNRWMLRHGNNRDDAVTADFGFAIRLRNGESVTSAECRYIGQTAGEAENGGERTTYRFEHSKFHIALECSESRATRIVEWRLLVTNRTAETLRIESILPAVGEWTLPETDEQLAYLNIGLQSTDMYVGCYPAQPEQECPLDGVTVFHSGGAVPDVMLGFTTFENFMTGIRFTYRVRTGSRRLYCEAFSECEGLGLAPGGTVASETVAFTADQVHDRLFASYMATIRSHIDIPLRFDRIPAGWLSWYCLYGHVTEADVLEQLEKLRSDYSGSMTEYVVVDAGWFQSSGFGDWTANDKFPNGMKRLADRIRGAGFKPGLWFSPLLVDAASALLKQHPDWVQRDGNGRPIVSMNRFGTDVYDLDDAPGGVRFALDLTHPEVLEFLHSLFRTVRHEWGYDYIKLDFLIRSLVTDKTAHAEDPFAPRVPVEYRGATTVQAYRSAMRTIREAVGPDCFVLGCAAPLFASVGDLIDGNRMTPDITRQNGPNRARPTSWQLVTTCARSMAARYFLHDRIGYNDPDVIVVRDAEPTGISDSYTPTRDEAQGWASVVALSAGMSFLGDKLTELSEDRKRIVDSIMPPYSTAAVPHDYFRTAGPPEIWLLPVERGEERWHVAGVFNWEDESRAIELDLDRLGLPDGRLFVSEFWQGTCAEWTQRRITVTLPPHSVRLYAIRPLPEQPAVVATDIHFTQGALDVPEATWQDRRLLLSVRLHNRREGKVSVYIPSELRTCRMEANIGYVRDSEELLAFRVNANTAETIELRFFTQRPGVGEGDVMTSNDQDFIRPFPVRDRWCVHSYYTISPYAPDGSGRILLAGGDLARQSGEVLVLSEAGEVLDRFGATELHSGFFHTGLWQTWSPDARYVYYQGGLLNRPRIVRRELETGEELTMEGDMEGAPPFGESIVSGLMGMLYAAGYGYGKFQPELAPVPFQRRREHGLFRFAFRGERGEMSLPLSVADVLDRHPDRDRLLQSDREVKQRLGSSDGLTLMCYCVRWNRDGSRLLFYFGNHNVDRTRGEPKLSYVFTADKYLGNIRLAVDMSYGKPGVHWSWHPDGEHLIGYGPDPEDEGRMCLAQVRFDGGGYRKISANASGGHPGISPADYNLLVTDTGGSPGEVLFIDVRTDEVIRSVKLPRVLGDSEPAGRNRHRICHHPVFSADGGKLIVNTLPEEHAVVCEMDVAEVLR